MAEHVQVRDRYRIVATCYVHRRAAPSQRFISRQPCRSRAEYEFLVIKRPASQKPFPGKWTVPGGGLEREHYTSLAPVAGGWEDPLHQTVVAEVDDEVGVCIGKITFLSHFVFIRENDQVPVLGVRFVAPYVSGDVRLNPQEATEHAWVSVEQASHYDFLGNVVAGMRQAEKYLRSRRS